MDTSDVSREDYLYAVLTDENPEVDAMARLRNVYPNVMSLEYDNARTRAAGIADDAAPPPTRRVRSSCSATSTSSRTAAASRRGSSRP